MGRRHASMGPSWHLGRLTARFTVIIWRWKDHLPLHVLITGDEGSGTVAHPDHLKEDSRVGLLTTPDHRQVLSRPQSSSSPSTRR